MATSDHSKSEHYTVTWQERPDWPLGGRDKHVVDTVRPEVTVCGLRVPPDAKPAHYRGICARCEEVVPWGRPASGELAGALRDYCELLFVGWTTTPTSIDLVASTENSTKTAKDVAWQGHDERARWVEQVCEQAAIDRLPVWSEPDYDITDALLASVGVIWITGAVELLRHPAAP